MLKGLLVVFVLFCLKEVLSEVSQLNETESLIESKNDSSCSKEVQSDFKRSSKDELIFKLYTGKDISHAETKKYDGKHTLKFKHLVKKLPVIIFTHDGSGKNYIKSLQKTFLKSMGFKNQNLIFLQWPGKEDPKEAVKVGKLLSKAIKDLRKDGAHNHYIIIGHGYGAIVAGKAGNELSGNKVYKIVGLDPPSKIEKVHSDNRLGKKSAHVVEVVHTSIGAGGLEKPIGHRDFYPNGGETPQPFCWKNNTGCNRNLAYKIYMASYRSKSDYFESTICVSWRKYLDGVCDDNASVNLYNDISLKDAKEGKYYLEVDEDYLLDS